MLETYTNRQILEENLKQKSVDELFQIALTANDDDDADNPGWAAITVLRHIATREVFKTAKAYTASDYPNTRSIGVFILIDLGFPTRPYLDEVLGILFNLLATEQEPDVLSDAALVLGFISPEPRKVAPLLKLKSHPDADVRYGVTHGLLHEEDPLAIEALIELSSDEDDDVRDWATFGLGVQIDTDTPEIREALFKRAIDPDDKSNAPGEALVGLARRHDERAFALILKCLQSGNAGNLIFEAAEELADARFLPALISLQNDPKYANSRFFYDLESAIAAYKGL